jgi:hypothetical protein
MLNDLLFEVISNPSLLAQEHFYLQIAIHKVIRIQLGGITLQKEHFDLVSMFFKPGLNHFAVVNPQVIHHKDHPPSRILDQALHESDQNFRRYVLPIEHENA